MTATPPDMSPLAAQLRETAAREAEERAYREHQRWRREQRELDHERFPNHFPAVVPEVPDDEAAPSSSWKPVDLEPVLNGTWSPVLPTIGKRTDGRGVFYPGKAHTVVSETEGGKTWFALSVCLDEMSAGNHIVYLDFEDDEGSVVGRLLTMGASGEVIRKQFHYLRPDAPITHGGNQADLLDLLHAHRPTLAVLDGITEAMGVHGLDPLKNVDAQAFGRRLTKPITDFGAATASLDHVVKDREGRGRYALGAVHKLNGLSGAQYILNNRDTFGIGLTGKSTVNIAKDRPAQLRAGNPKGASGMHWFGDLVVESHGQEFAEVSIEPPYERDPDFRPSHLMAEITAALQKVGQPTSQRVLLGLVRGKDETKREAFRLLKLDGYVTPETPHTLIKLYDGGEK